MSGKTVFVLRPFKILLNEIQMERGGYAESMVSFEAGRHDDVPDVITDHPYAQMFFGTEQQVMASITPVTPGAAVGAPTVPLAELQASQAEVGTLREHVSRLQSEVSANASQVASLQAQNRLQADALTASDSALTEANNRIRSLAKSLQGAGGSAPENTAPVEPTPATAPIAPVPPAPEAAPLTEDDQGEPDAEVGGLVVKHKGAGKYAVFRGDEQLTESMPKSEADDKALEIAAADALLKNPPKAADQPIENPGDEGAAA